MTSVLVMILGVGSFGKLLEKLHEFRSVRLVEAR